MQSTKLKWNSRTLPKSDIHLDAVLRSGQAFRWRKLNNIWSCVLSGRLVLLKEVDDLNEMKNQLKYTTLSFGKGSLIENDEQSSWNFIESYLSLKEDLNFHHLEWSKADPYFPQFRFEIPKGFIKGEIVKKEALLPTPPPSEISHGVRILNQNPWEVLISFIISSNNNIKRISQLCETLAIAYGKHIGKFDNLNYYTFPNPNELFRIDTPMGLKDLAVPNSSFTKLESQLRTLGFGYRAKYIASTAENMLRNHENWNTLINCDWKTDEECVEFLIQFNGVGPKVADCVALMGCQRQDLVPIDTHVWKIVQGIYKEEFKKWVTVSDIEADVKKVLRKSLSNKAVDARLYPYVKRFFKDYWKVKAGWAQAVVFAGEIKLENGINSVEDYDKLIAKVQNAKLEVLEKPITKEKNL